jgi:hypothetical protein
MNGRRLTRAAALPLMVLVMAAGALTATRPATAATVPAHNSPDVYCENGRMMVDLPSMVSTTLRSEKVKVKYHLLKKVAGTWRYLIPDDQYFTNFATSGGALLGGWQPNDGSSYWGQTRADFYMNGATGEYRVAMEITWMSSGAYTYEWAGYHIFDDAWNFRKVYGTSCLY